MRIVLDTNVLIAAFVSRGVCAELVEHCVREQELVSSNAILDEFEEKLVDKFGSSRSEANSARALLRRRMQMVEPLVFAKQVSRDPDDDVILGTAIAGAADCLITGDGDLLDIEEFEGVRILSPRDFWSYESLAE